ncbi:MAG: hypothetical protein SVW02_01100 [Candidatus Nanohaloarchaea archaeon]|nr:hypothetical protein [Candidatus Nanohaloarchaea archaeon]
MDSVATRRTLIAVLLPATALLILYGVFATTAGSTAAAAVLLLLTVTLLVTVETAETVDPHQINLVQEKSYRITLRSVLATAILTGIVLLAVLYGAAAVIGVVAAFAGYETLSFQLFADAVGRLALLLEIPATQLVAGYAAVAVAMGAGFWILFPYLPTQDEEIAAPATFLATGVYVAAVGAMFASLPVSQPASLALDAAIVAFWGHFFALAYEDVEKYVP